MSQFLQNLIGRHQEAGVHEEVMALVQPRPKSRFESASEPKSLAQTVLVESDDVLEKSQFNSDAESDQTQGLPSSRPIAASETNRSALDTQVTIQQSNESPVIQTDSSDQIKNLNERIETLTLQLGKESPVLETPNSATGNLNNVIAGDHLESQKISEYPNPENLKPVTQHDHTAVEIDNFPENTPQQHTDSILETISKFQQPDVKEKQQTIESGNKQRSSNQTGLLKIPDWLSEMQADLNNRMQQLQTQSNPEPVVNVTIGRVEVKAVQPNAIKQPKIRNKPSGVMGLGDYLKQRERRGRR